MTELARRPSLIDRLPPVRGKYTPNAPIGQASWFKCGGTADVLFKPKNETDLQDFLSTCPVEIPITVLGASSNVIIRDGGIEGIVIRLTRGFNTMTVLDDFKIEVGAICLDMNVATFAQSHGIGGLEFFAGIPGTIGGALKMNAGAYGRETKDVLVSAQGFTRQGDAMSYNLQDLNMSYRHSDVPEGVIFTKAIFQGFERDKDEILNHIQDIKAKREESQPIREQTGGSTFANPSLDDLNSAGLPEETKVWQLIDQVGGRGLQIGGAQMSEKHCNFMINTGSATASDLEGLGEEIRARVLDKFGVTLRWEIKRIGRE